MRADRHGRHRRRLYGRDRRPSARLPQRRRLDGHGVDRPPGAAAAALRRAASCSRWTPTRPAAPPTCAPSRSSPPRPPDAPDAPTTAASRAAGYPRAGAAAGQGPGRADPQRPRGLARRRRIGAAGRRPPHRGRQRRPRPRRAARPLAAGAEVLPAIGEVADPVLQAHYLQRLSRLARVSEDALRRQMPRRAARSAAGDAAKPTMAPAAAVARHQRRIRDTPGGVLPGAALSRCRRSRLEGRCCATSCSA